MESITTFRNRVADTLARMDQEVLSFDPETFWMIRVPYEFLEYYAEKHRYYNMALALPVARGLHKGAFRKTPIMRDGQAYRPPYMLHCLTVCKLLADLWLPVSDEEKDILLAAALCHDTIEDCGFQNGGRELVTDYFLDPRVFETVKLVSKRKDFTEEEEKAYFRGIEENRFALLIKLSDRGHNVTDLYSMSDSKIEEYVGETRTWILPMCEYARLHYPEFSMVVEILQDQMICLTKTVEMLSEQHQTRTRELLTDLQLLRNENERLLAQTAKIREGGESHE